jgi:hypothetical protein
VSEKPFDPLARINLGKAVAEAMLERKVHPLRGLPRFSGSGIYAIYYTGSFPLYQPIAARNAGGKFAAPIYVGKAIPKGGRKGGEGDAEADTGVSLHKRLSEHAKSVEQVENLDIEDFHCRYLIVEDIWIPLGESLLIAKFAPIWNKMIDGFGNHPPGKGRWEGMRPRWDVLHPGRPGFTQLQDRKESREQIEGEVKQYLASIVVPPKPTMFDDSQ